MTHFTEAQRIAVETLDRNLIVAAGAGSGKTYVLVNRYIRLLDEHRDWPLNAIVAVTFTKKAAQEMRGRVRGALAERLSAATTPDDVACWSGRLASVDSARIDTIHALCASILRANAAEAGIDPGFEVLDETDSSILLDNVIDDTLRRLVAEADPALALFAEYDEAKVRKAVRGLIGQELGGLPGDFLQHWSACRDAELRLRLDDFKAQRSVLAGFQAPGGDSLSENWVRCAELFDLLSQTDDLNAVRAALDEIAAMRLPGRPAKGWGETGEAAKAVFALVRDAAKSLHSMALDRHDQRAAQLAPLWAALLHRVQTAYRQAKAAASVLDFDDLERLTQRLLDAHDRVRARYAGLEFRHLLVDEFQDTNAAQWRIVRALADPAQRGGLFVVGDEKQSIYAFRGADISVFNAVRAQITQSGGAQVALATSFRTHRALVDWSNHLFSRLLTPAGDTLQTYEATLETPMEAVREAPAAVPPVELLLIESTKGDGLDSELKREWEAREIASRLRQMVDEGRPVYRRETGAITPLTYGDIALLFQSSSIIELYEAVFKQAGLPFVTVAGQGYYGRQEVWDLLSLLQALYNPADDLALASALRSPLFSLSDDVLLALRLSDSGDVPTLLRTLLARAAADPASVAGLPDDEHGQVIFADRCLDELSKLAGRVTISEVLRAALDRTGYLAVLTGLPDGARRRGNVEKLLDKAQTAGKITLSAFSHYVRDLSSREAREGEAVLDTEGAIRLMTVHRSKGLEFPLVVLPNASWRGNTGDVPMVILDQTLGLTCRVYDADAAELATPSLFSQVWEGQKLRLDAERKRLLYVAVTRAQDYLLISGQVTRDSGPEAGLKSSGWLDWLLDALELRGLERREVIDAGPGLQVRFPLAPIDEPGFDNIAHSGWGHPAVETGRPLPAASVAPPLVAPVSPIGDAPARSLTATQIADIGSALSADPEMQRRLYRDRFRRRLVHGAPSFIHQVSEQRRGLSKRKIGNMVHRALRLWRFPDGGSMDDLLRKFAWDEAIVDPKECEEAVLRARGLLHKFKSSDVYDWIDTARSVYRELPFIFQSTQRTIHGVLDVLLERNDGTWMVLDYKTSTVPRYEAMSRREAVQRHARRYHLQVGVYAAAVRELLRDQTGQEVVPDVFIHYIREEITVAIPADAWTTALETLEDQIGDLLR